MSGIMLRLRRSQEKKKEIEKGIHTGKQKKVTLFNEIPPKENTFFKSSEGK